MTRSAVAAAIAITIGTVVTFWPLVIEYVEREDLDTRNDIVMAGGHFRWAANGTLELEVYVFNSADHGVALDASMAREALRVIFIADSTRTTEESYGSIVAPWQPHEQRQETFHLPGYPPKFRAYLAYPHEHEHWNWNYRTYCNNGALRPDPPCREETQYLPDTFTHEQNEAEWRAHLRSCCAWDAPPFDFHDTRCTLTAADLVCTTSAYNYHLDTQSGNVTITVHAETGQILFEREVERAATLVANETRVFETTFSDALPTLAQAQAATLSVVASGHHPDYERSRSWDIHHASWPEGFVSNPLPP